MHRRQGRCACSPLGNRRRRQDGHRNVSGKTWMRDLWARHGFEFSDDQWGDVWRLEIRFGKGFLRERNIRHPAEIARFLPELIAEALSTRRLCVPTNDMKRRRWPMHPLWTAAYRARGASATGGPFCRSRV